VSPGTVFQGSEPLVNPVTVTIGSTPAGVSFAGLAGTGLYQINVTIPSLADGDHEVIAHVQGIQTASGVFLKTVVA